jgi:hypothetical protein
MFAMPAYRNCPDLSRLDAASIAELQAVAAEAIGWHPLGPGVYLHHGDPELEENVIEVVGIPHASMAGMNVLLLG